MRRRNEKGAITLFVLIAGLSFIAFLTTMLAVAAVRRQAQIEATKQAKEIYSRGDANHIYEEYFIREGAIPIYTPAQLNEMCTGHEIAINEEGGKIYTFSSDAVYVLMNNLAFESEGFWQMPQFTENGRFEGNGKIIRFKNTSNNKECYYSNENNYKTAIFPVEVTFDANGGSVSTASKTVKHGLSYGDLPTPTKTGYTFAGWNGKNLLNSSDTSRTLNGLTINVSNNVINIHGTNTKTDAYWGLRSFEDEMLPNLEPGKKYTLTISKNLQDLYVQLNYKNTSGTTESLLRQSGGQYTFTVPNDYQQTMLYFIGVRNTATNIDDEFTVQLEEGDTATAYEPYYVTSNTQVTQPANHTLTARWNANTYTVTFDANGGSGGQSGNVTATYGQTMPAISTTAPTRTGYTFAGWYDTSEATGGTQYYTAEGTSARTWDKTSLTVLYARWIENTLTIKYYANGATKNSSGASVNELLSTEVWNFSRTVGYNWPTDYPDPYGFSLVRDGYNPTWVYHVGSATSSKTIPVDLVRNYTTTIEQLAELLGVKEQLYQGNVVLGIYAGWTPINYTISYNLNGGTVSGNPTTYNITSSSIMLNSPTKSGATFIGWIDSQDEVGYIEGGVEMSGTKFIFTNPVSGNSYNTSKLQIWSSDKSQFLQQINSSEGETVSSDWVCPYDTGYYYLRYGTNGNLYDNCFTLRVKLEKGTTYHYGWNVDSFNANRVETSNLQFYKKGGSVVTIPNNLIPAGSTGNRTLTAVWQ